MSALKQPKSSGSTIYWIENIFTRCEGAFDMCYSFIERDKYSLDQLVKSVRLWSTVSEAVYWLYYLYPHCLWWSHDQRLYSTIDQSHAAMKISLHHLVRILKHSHPVRHQISNCVGKVSVIWFSRMNESERYISFCCSTFPVSGVNTTYLRQIVVVKWGKSCGFTYKHSSPFPFPLWGWVSVFGVRDLGVALSYNNL